MDNMKFVKAIVRVLLPFFVGLYIGAYIIRDIVSTQQIKLVDDHSYLKAAFYSGTDNVTDLDVPVVDYSNFISTHFFKESKAKLKEIIEKEYAFGLRDQYYIPKNYTIRENNGHWNDIGHKDRFQLELYLYAKDLIIRNNFHLVIDIGCGSGYKLVKYISSIDNVKTIGFETEPAISYLKKTYLKNTWVDSGKPDRDFKNNIDTTDDYFNLDADLIINADVIEHILQPELLLDFMLSFNKTKYFLISTPKREPLGDPPYYAFNGPPYNKNHVREWTFHEFQLYLSKHFIILKSFIGVRDNWAQFHLCQRKF